MTTQQDGDERADHAAVLDQAARWQSALEARDVEAAGALLHEDFALVLVLPDRTVMARDEWLTLLPEYVVHSWDPSQRVVDVLGDVATVFQAGEQNATVGGADRSGRFVLTDTWVRQAGGDGWRLWRRHSTPLTAGPIPRVEMPDDVAG